jgi:hypothetical protein
VYWHQCARKSNSAYAVVLRYGDYGDGHRSVGVYEGVWDMECVVVLWRAVALD